MTDQTKTNLELPIEKLDDLLKRVDEDRWLSSRYAPKSLRMRLITLYAFQLECVRALHMSEPMLGHIRIQWWREALEEIAQGAPVRRHDLTQEIAKLMQDAPGVGPLAAEYLGHFDEAIDAAARKESSDALILAGGVLAQMAGALLDEGAGKHAEELAQCGQAYESARMKAPEAGQSVATAREAFQRLPAALTPAIAHVALASAYLDRAELSGLYRRWRIFRSVLTGRA